MTYYWLKGDSYTVEARLADTLKGGSKSIQEYIKRRSQRLVI